MDELLKQFDGPRQFVNDSVHLLRRCEKPDRQGAQLNDGLFSCPNSLTINAPAEFLKIAQAVALGFLVMGAIGYFVKLIHIPINNIIVYESVPFSFVVANDCF